MTANHTKHHPDSLSPNGSQPSTSLVVDPAPTDLPSALPAADEPQLPPHQPLRVIPLGLAFSLSAAIALVALSAGVGSYLVLQSRIDQERDRKDQTILQQAEAHRRMADFQSCLDQVSQIEPTSSVFVEAQPIQHSCRQGLIAREMERAQQLATQGQYRQAIAGLSQLAANYDDGSIRDLMKQLAQRMLDMAWKYYNSPTNGFGAALTVLQAIPSNSPLFDEAQDVLQQMRTNWQANQHHVQAASDALQRQDLTAARIELEQMIPHPFWDVEAQPLRQHLDREQFYANLWQRAEESLDRQDPGQAIALARQLPDTPPWQERKEQIQVRAEAAYATLLQQAEEALDRQEPANAIALAQKLPNAFPWQERKERLITQAEADISRQNFCQSLPPLLRSMTGCSR